MTLQRRRSNRSDPCNAEVFDHEVLRGADRTVASDGPIIPPRSRPKRSIPWMLYWSDGDMSLSNWSQPGPLDQGSDDPPIHVLRRVPDSGGKP
jgi:hypothetical protein